MYSWYWLRWYKAVLATVAKIHEQWHLCTKSQNLFNEWGSNHQLVIAKTFQYIYQEYILLRILIDRWVHSTLLVYYILVTVMSCLYLGAYVCRSW